MDQGTDAADVLQNRVIPLKLGYVGLVMRGQKAITEEVDIKSSLRTEAFNKNYIL
jgi:dynamin 1-like protein